MNCFEKNPINCTNQLVIEGARLQIFFDLSFKKKKKN